MKLIKEVFKITKIKMFVDKHNIRGQISDISETTLYNTPKCLSAALWRRYSNVAPGKWHHLILTVTKEA
jgi:hypothetical protein